MSVRRAPGSSPRAAKAPNKRSKATKVREPDLFSDASPQASTSAAPSDSAKGNIVYTVGHSTLAIEDFLARLKGHGITLLVDVRKMPGSRRHPQFGRDALEQSLAHEGIRYLHAPELGGFRKARPDSPNGGWRNASFQGYADYMMTAEFDAALRPILLRASEEKQALMCAEAVPWRCHRSLVADALTVRGVRVEEIQSPTRTSTHALTPFARVDGAVILYPPT